DMPWVSLYWIFSVLLLVALSATLFVRFPSVETSNESLTGSSSYFNLFKRPIVWLFFGGIFSYVAAEQGISIFLSTFLFKMHDINPQETGAIIVSWFWGMMTIGCVVGMVLLKLYDCRKLLRISGFISMGLLSLALWGNSAVAVIAFPLIGFSISMMFGVVFSLALNSVSSHHGAFAGILCSGIVGGAAGPLLISIIADYAGLKTGLCLAFLFIAYITMIGYWAKPLVNNKTMSLREMLHLSKA
ncbi:MAG: MFS transporter, partial [Bacteroidaceae bacterium]